MAVSATESTRYGDAKVSARTAKIYMLRNYEMKDEISCFVVFKIDKYEINYIVTARNIAYRGIPFVPNEIFHCDYFRLGRNVLFGPDQYISF